MTTSTKSPSLLDMSLDRFNIWTGILRKNLKLLFSVIKNNIALTIFIPIFLVIFLRAITRGGEVVYFNQGKERALSPISSIADSIKSPTPALDSEYVLQRKTPGGVKSIFIFERTGVQQIIRWKDLLLFTNQPDWSEKGGVNVIYQHDIDSGNTSQLFQKQSKLTLAGLNVIGNTLYFYLGDYLQDGESYWIDLNSSDKVVHKLIDRSGIVEEIRGRYFFISSEADACWNKEDFSLIDLQTKQLTPLAETQSGCREGEEYLGINKRDQMLLADQKGVVGYGDYDWTESRPYTSIIIISLVSPFERTFLIPPESMPSGIVRIEYSEDSDSLLFVGDAIYLHTFSSGIFEKIIDLPKEWVEYKKYPSMLKWSDGDVCIQKSDERHINTITLLVNLETRKIVNDSSRCIQEPQTRSIVGENDDEKAKKKFEDLQLPSSYSLTHR